MLHALIVPLFGETTYQIFSIILGLYYIWLPVILIILFMDIWLRYRRAYYILSQGSVLLEVKIPREINKSPAAMEVALTSMFQTAAASYVETYIDGKVRPWFSLELVSLEGEVHFYIWMHKKFRNNVEALIYAQYPEVEIKQVPDYAVNVDYTLNADYEPEKYGLWGTYFKLKKPNAVAMKTYIDYGLGLTDNPKEEFKIDPITPTLDFLSSIGPGEQVWIQILIQAHKKTGLKEGEPHFSVFFDNVKKFFTGKDAFTVKSFKAMYHLENEDWQSEIKEAIKAVNESLKDEIKDPKDPSKKEKVLRRPTRGEIDSIATMERRVSKYPFETMIRGFYIAKKENFSATGISGLIGSVRQYTTNDSNGFKLGWFTDHQDNPKDFFRYFFKKSGIKRRRKMEQRMLEAYKLRSFFQHPYRYFKEEPYILTTEEIATIYHFPGQVAATPGLVRIPSKRAQAPANLPI